MLGTEVEFSTWVSQALEIAYSGLFSVSASRWLRTATSRVVIPNLARISLSCSDGFWGSMVPECTALVPFGASASQARLWLRLVRSERRQRFDGGLGVSLRGLQCRMEGARAPARLRAQLPQPAKLSFKLRNHES